MKTIGLLVAVFFGVLCNGSPAIGQTSPPKMKMTTDIPEEIRTILFDPQTAGGLLLSVARADTDALLAALTGAGVPAVEIGEVLPPGKPLIQVV